MWQGCDYCEEGRPFQVEENKREVFAEIRWVDRPATVIFEAPIDMGEFGKKDISFTMPITYCPMCGRKLRISKEEW